MDRPILLISKNWIDKTLDIITIGLLVSLIVYPLFQFSSLPDLIPSHFNFKGEADAYNSKNLIWVMPLFALGISFGIGFLKKVPHILNFPIAISESNAEIQYKLAIRMLSILNDLIVSIFAYITFQKISGSSKLDIPFILVFLASIFLILGIYIFLSIRNK